MRVSIIGCLLFYRTCTELQGAVLWCITIIPLYKGFNLLNRVIQAKELEALLPSAFYTDITTCCIIIISLADLYSIPVIMWHGLFNNMHIIDRCTDVNKGGKLHLWRMLLKVFSGLLLPTTYWKSAVVTKLGHIVHHVQKGKLNHFWLFICHRDVTE